MGLPLFFPPVVAEDRRYKPALAPGSPPGLRKREDKGAMALTVKKVAALRRRPGRYGDGHGLVLQVISPTNVSWLFCYERQGRAHQMGLGPLHTIGLKEARERARAARQLLLDGIDPLEQKRAERDARAAEAARSVTFKTCAERYYTAHADEWTNVKHRRQFLATMQSYVYPVMGALSVAAIDEAMVLKVPPPREARMSISAAPSAAIRRPISLRAPPSASARRPRLRTR
jgi:hypothetical protein